METESKYDIKSIEDVESLSKFKDAKSLKKKSLNPDEKKGPSLQPSWKVHPKLPEGWMMKVDDAKRIHFLTKDKTRMSVLAAIRFMKTSPDFGIKDIVAIQQITDEVNPKTNVETEPRNHSEWSSHP